MYRGEYLSDMPFFPLYLEMCRGEYFKYLDNHDLISSKTSLKYKQYIPITIAKQYMVIESQGLKIR